AGCVRGPFVGPRRGVGGGEVLRGVGVRRPLRRRSVALPPESEVPAQILAEVLAELAHLLGQLGQALAQPRRPVAPGEVALHLLGDAARVARLLFRRVPPGAAVRLLRGAPAPRGLLRGAAARALGPGGLSPPLLLGAAHLLLGGAPSLLVAQAREVR